MGVSRIPDAVVRCRPDDDDREWVPALEAGRHDRRGVETGLRISERGAWRTRTLASIDAADILDVDYGSHESSVASAKRAAEQQVLPRHPSADTTISPRVERVLLTLARFGTGKGVTVKARTALPRSVRDWTMLRFAICIR